MNGSAEATEVEYTGTPEELEALVERGHGMRSSLYRYVRETVLAQPGYVDGRHIRTICDTVQSFLDGPGRGLTISMPPRHMKSTIVAESLPAWWLATHPQGEIIIASYNQGQARKMARSVRLAFDREAHRQMMADSEWEVDSADVLQLAGKLNGRPSLIAAGVGSGITGSGADLLIIDDPVKDMAEAESQTMRDRVYEWYASTAFTRLSPGGKVVIVATRWHYDDLIGRVLEDDASSWQVLNLPAISDDGQALWPERYGLESLADIKRSVGSRVFEALYQGRPTPLEGGMFRRSWARFGPRFPDDARRCRYWDKAATSGGGDWTVGVLMAEYDGRYCVEDVVRLQGSPQEVQSRIRATADMDGYDVSIRMEQEPGSSGVDVIDLYSRRILTGFDFRPEKVTGDKATRANGLAAAMEAGNVDLVRASWNRDLLDELAAFPLGAHDDQVDAMSGAFRELSRGGAPGVWVLRPPRFYKHPTSRKTMQGRMVEVKAGQEDGTFSGLLSTYGNLDAVGDICEKGCFDRTIRERGIKRPLLWQHDQSQPIGSFVVSSAEDALSIEGRFNMDVAKGREAYALLKAQDIDGLSIGYIARDFDYDSQGVRHLKDVDLLEGSLVTIPANDLARAQAKRLDTMSKYAQMQSLKGLTESQRKAILAELDGLEVGDVDEDGNTVIEVIDVDLPGEKANDEAEDEQCKAEDQTEDEDAKAAKEDAPEDDDDEVEDALKALASAIAKLKAKMKA